MIQEKIQSPKTSGQMLSTARSLGMTDAYVRQWLCLVAVEILTSLNPICPHIPALGKQEKGATDHTIFPSRTVSLHSQASGQQPLSQAGFGGHGKEQRGWREQHIPVPQPA